MATHDRGLPAQRETQIATIAAHVEAGYTVSFGVDGPGISGPPTVQQAAPEEFSVMGEYRFEGISDPDDEALVMAVKVASDAPLHAALVRDAIQEAGYDLISA